MIRPILTGLLAICLASCSSQNTSLSTLQFSDATVPYPENYETEAARVVQARGGDVNAVQVSEPRPTLGEGPLAPRRWSICLRGLPPVGERPVTRPVEYIGELLGQRSGAGVYDVVLFFSERLGRPSVRSGYDSPLCKDVPYRPLTAAPPAT